MTRTRWIGSGVVVVTAIVVGILYGYVAGVAVALAVPTVLLLGSGWRISRRITEEGGDPLGHYWEKEGFGSDPTGRRRRQ